MLYDNVMVPFDGSESAMAALAEAIRYAKEDPGMNLFIVQIIDTEDLVAAKLNTPALQRSAVPEGMREALDEVIKDASKTLHRQVDEMLHGLMNRIEIDFLEETNPGAQIVAYAQENKCDLIVMGSRGLGGLRGILGSVSSLVLREADMPVLVVKD